MCGSGGIASHGSGSANCVVVLCQCAKLNLSTLCRRLLKLHEHDVKSPRGENQCVSRCQCSGINQHHAALIAVGDHVVHLCSGAQGAGYRGDGYRLRTLIYQAAISRRDSRAGWGAPHPGVFPARVFFHRYR